LRIIGSAALAGYRAVSELAGKASVFALTVVAARRLVPTDFGLVALGMTLGWMAAVAGDFGIGLHLARETACQPDARARLFDTWLRARLHLAAATGACLVLGLAILRVDGSAALTIAGIAAAYAASGVLESVSGFFRGLSRTDIESTLTLIQRPAQLMCALLVLVWRPDPRLLALALLLPALATLALGLRVARRLSRTPSVASSTLNRVTSSTPNVERTPNGERRTQHDKLQVWHVFARDVAPIGIGLVLSALYFRLDVVLLEWGRGYEAVGLYNAVFRLVEGLRLLPAAVLAVALPDLARAASRRPVMRLAAWMTAAAVLITAALLAAADWIVVTAYGPPYAAATPAFRVLLVAFPLMTLNYALTTQLVAWNGQRTFAALCAAALVLNLSLNARLIPAYSFLGAAWSTLATEAFLTAGCVGALAAGAWTARSATHPAVHES
jgi:O-antigen/teichoic acid export membrane protein